MVCPEYLALTSTFWLSKTVIYRLKQAFTGPCQVSSLALTIVVACGVCQLPVESLGVLLLLTNRPPHSTTRLLTASGG
jgi:hypothetical protein